MICDILIKNAKTRKLDDLVNIAVKDGKIAAIEKGLEAEAKQVIDAAGCLVTESFVNGHLHLDKVYTLKMAGEDALKSYTGGGMGGAMTSIEQAANFKAAYDESWLIGNVRKACDLAVKYGNTHIRAFADVDSKARLEGVKALLKAREEYKDRVTLEVVAFPQDGVAREPAPRSWSSRRSIWVRTWSEASRGWSSPRMTSRRMWTRCAPMPRSTTSPSPCCSTTWATARSARWRCSAASPSRWAGRAA